LLRGNLAFAFLTCTALGLSARGATLSDLKYHQSPDKDGVYYVGPEVSAPRLVSTVYVPYPDDVADKALKGMTVMAMVINTERHPGTYPASASSRRPIRSSCDRGSATLEVCAGHARSETGSGVDRRAGCLQPRPQPNNPAGPHHRKGSARTEVSPSSRTSITEPLSYTRRPSLSTPSMRTLSIRLSRHPYMYRSRWCRCW
jgi:hypothetical protein